MGKISNIKKLYFDYSDFYKNFYNMNRDIYSFKNSIGHILKTESSIKNKQSKIMEYGCGSGFNLNYLADQGFLNLHGIEQNEIAYRECLIHKKQNINVQNINFISDADFYKEENFDFIFTRGVLQQQKGIGKIEGDFNTDDDVVKILKKFISILNPDGVVVLNEGQNTRDWEKIINESGFIIKHKNTDFFILHK